MTAYVTPAPIQSIWRAKSFAPPISDVGQKITQKNYHYTGNGYIAGEAPSGGSQDGRLKINGVPGIGRLMLYERRGNGRLVFVTETKSAADGTWRIDFLSRDCVYLVIGVDQSGTYSLGGQDWITPVAM